MPKPIKRILIYSHDSFGLGHLRRCMTIANYLVEQNKNLTILILTGSPIIGRFDFKTRVDFVRIPGVIKKRNGNYTALQLHLNIADTLRLREEIIRNTALSFDPDLFIVDKEPLGLRGEVKSTLEILNAHKTPCVLGLRDIMDDPDLLEPEWERKKAIPALCDLYQAIWVYGLLQICDPMDGLNMPKSVIDKTHYTGYLHRHIPTQSYETNLSYKTKSPYFLVTPGGGGDGILMVDWVLKAYEHNPNINHPALIVLGPFMKSKHQIAFEKRAKKLPQIEIIRFHPQMESLYQNAIGVVAMGGYNTFCEILSFNKRALILPRTKPRLEQMLRAQRASTLGLVSFLDPEQQQDSHVMAQALCELPQKRLPSECFIPNLLDGLKNVNVLQRAILNAKDTDSPSHSHISRLNAKVKA
ncbi:MAG: glycosyltransferase [Pseudomonadota bacterium]